MTEKYEYCSTVSRTFVQDSRIGIVPAVLSLLSLDDSSCTFDVFGLILQNNSKFGQQ